MKNKYDKIQGLISLWNEFEQHRTHVNFREFGQWLTCVKGENEPWEGCDEEEKLTEDSSEHLFFYKQMPPQRQFLTLLSRAARFLDFYIRKAFEELSINSRLEFQFLISIKEMKHPKTTDIINFNLVEISTGIETLKRLKRKGLIDDITDEHDKRVKRIMLTDEGNATVNKALVRFDDLDRLVHTFDKEDNWKNFIPILMMFNDYHTEVYHQYKDESFDDILTNLGIYKPH